MKIVIENCPREEHLSVTLGPHEINCLHNYMPIYASCHLNGKSIEVEIEREIKKEVENTRDF